MKKIGPTLFLLVLPIGVYVAGGLFADGSIFSMHSSRVHSDNTFIFSVVDNESLEQEIPHISDSCYGLKMKISYGSPLGITAAVDEIRQQHKMINIVSIQKTSDQKSPEIFQKTETEPSLIGTYSSPAEYRCARSIANTMARTLGLNKFELRQDPKLYLTSEASLAMAWTEQTPVIYEAQTRPIPLAECPSCEHHP